MLTDPRQSKLLPVGMPLGGVDAENICACLQQCRNAGCIIAGVDSGAYDIPFVSVQEFVRVLLMSLIVFAENEVTESATVINDGKRIQLVIPDDVVGFLQGGAFLGPDKFIERSHKIADGRIGSHPADAVITAGNHADKFPVSGAVFGDRNGGVPGLILQDQDVAKRGVGADI